MKATSSVVNETAIHAFEKIHAELNDILNQEKCRSCSCLYADVLNRVLDKIRIFRNRDSDQRLVTIENDFERWVKDAECLEMHQ